MEPVTAKPLPAPMCYWGRDLLGWALLYAIAQCDAAILDDDRINGCDFEHAYACALGCRGGYPNFVGQEV